MYRCATPGNKTHDETAIHVIDVSLQRCLVRILANVERRTRETNLILNNCISDIVDQATKLLRILDVVEETLDLSLHCQRLECLSGFFQFPEDPNLSHSVYDLEGGKPTFPNLFS